MQIDISSFLRGLGVALFWGAVFGAVNSLLIRGRIDLEIVLFSSACFGTIPLFVVFLIILFSKIGAGQSAVSSPSGRIAPNKIIGTVTIIIFSLFAAGGIFLMLNDEPSLVIFGFILCATCITLVAFSVPSLTQLHDVTWDEVGIEGPSRTFGLTLGLARTQIEWADVVSTGETKTQYWFVQSADGRRIYWNGFYSGCDAFGDQLARRCINLNDPE